MVKHLEGQKLAEGMSCETRVEEKRLSDRYSNID
jgi:hypothetical protein